MTAAQGTGRGLTHWAARASVYGLPLLFVLWSTAHLEGFSWDYDEGAHTVVAWLVQQGHPLYTQTFSAYTPGYIYALVFAYNLFGATMVTARTTTVLIAALGLVGVMRVAGELSAPLTSAGRTAVAKWPGALAAGVLLICTPSFLRWSRAAMSDLPAAALTMLAVALALAFMRGGRLRWLFASEVVLAAALWVKAIAIGGALAVAVAVLIALRAQRVEPKRAWLGTLLVGALALLPLFFFDVRGLLEQAIYFHVQKRAAYDQMPLDNLFALNEFLGNNPTLVTLAALGAVAGLARRAARPATAVLCVGAVATYGSLLFQTPMFPSHHPVVLVFPLAALAGSGVAVGIGDLLSVLSKRSGSVRLLVSVPVLLIALANLGQYPQQLGDALAPPFQPDAEEAVRLLRALSPADELLVSDAQVIAFRAQRQPPPPLSDTSSARLASGNLTADQLIAVTRQANANAVLFWSGRLESVPAFVDWVGANYRLVRSSFQRPTTSYRLFVREPKPQVALKAQIGDGIALWGYDVNRRGDAPLQAGQPLSLTLYFERVGSVGASYTLFAHLLDAGGRVVAQDDHLPLAGRYPTDQWGAGEIIADESALPLADSVSVGDYTVEIGFYQRETLQRLPISVGGARQAGDRLLLNPIHVR